VKRGDIIVIAPPAPFGKPRPALILQAAVLEDNELITVALISSDPAFFSRAFRIPIRPTPENGLKKPSEIVIDNIQTIPVERVGGLIGEAGPEIMRAVDASLRLFFSLP